MNVSPPTTETTLIIRRTFPAPREKVFQAWTKPEQLKKWFAASEDYVPAVAEVDLRVGGTFRLGMRNVKNDAQHVATGIYREIRPPEKLVFTWSWEGEPESGETLVTIEFHDVGESTEIIFVQEFFPDVKRRDEHAWGWNGCFDILTRILQT